MSAKSATTISPPPPLRAEKQKVFPKPEIKRVGIVAGKPFTVFSRATQGVAEPEKVLSTADRSNVPKAAGPYQPRFRIGSGISENPFQPDPHFDWGINEESL